MLSFLAFFSWWLLLMIHVYCWIFSIKDGFLVRSHQKYRLKLWMILLVTLILGIDFAIVQQMGGIASGGLRLCAFDAAVLTIPLLFGALTKWTFAELWVLATIIGTVGMVSLPSIASHGR